MRIVNFLNVSVLGLIDFRFGELLNPDTLVVDDALEVAHSNPDVVRGFKIRLSEDVVGHEWKPLLKKSVALAEQAKLPLMVHIGETEEPLPMVLDHLRPGDIVAHCYTGKPNGILDGDTVHPAVMAARQWGVLFDSAHGKSNLSFEVARRAIADGFLPDVLSSDTSARNWRGPVFDLLTSISKLVALGAPFEECIRRATVVPAELLGIGRGLRPTRSGWTGPRDRRRTHRRGRAARRGRELHHRTALRAHLRAAQRQARRRSRHGAVCGR